MLPTRRAVLAGLMSAIWVSPVRAGDSGERALVMYRRVGCPWCKAWDRDIGAIYPRTDLGELFPLREVELGQEGDGGISLSRPVRYTPTFVLVESDTELARIEGYPGEDFFWARLEILVHEHAPAATNDPANTQSEDTDD
jgi:thioredoxin-related protein